MRKPLAVLTVVVIIAALVGAWSVDLAVLDRQVRREIAVLREAGHPSTLSELRSRHNPQSAECIRFLALADTPLGRRKESFDLMRPALATPPRRGADFLEGCHKTGSLGPVQRQAIPI